MVIPLALLAMLLVNNTVAIAQQKKQSAKVKTTTRITPPKHLEDVAVVDEKLLNKTYKLEYEEELDKLNFIAVEKEDSTSGIYIDFKKNYRFTLRSNSAECPLQRSGNCLLNLMPEGEKFAFVGTHAAFTFDQGVSLNGCLYKIVRLLTERENHGYFYGNGFSLYSPSAKSNR